MVQGSGGGVGRVEPREVELVERIDDAAAEKLTPDVVDGGARELAVGGEEPAEGFTQGLAGLRRPAAEGVKRIDAGLAAVGFRRPCRAIAAVGIQRVLAGHQVAAAIADHPAIGAGLGPT